jgi:uncharacterized protein (TIGR02594 family)
MIKKKHIVYSIIILFIFSIIVYIASLNNKTQDDYLEDVYEDFYVELNTKLNPLQAGLLYYGETEKTVTGVNNSTILTMLQEFESWVTDTDTPWCSAYMNYVHAKTGYEYTGKLNARSWLNVGLPVMSPEMGDVVVLWRSSPNSWKGHVGMFIRYSIDRKYIYLLGGNQGNKVSINRYSINRVLGYRKLKKLHSIQSDNLFANQIKISLN